MIVGVSFSLAILVALAWLHRYTQGRSTPTALAAFLIAGPALGVAAFLPVAVAEASSAVPHEGRPWSIYGQTPLGYAAAILCVGALAAAIAASVSAWRMRDELRLLRLGPLESPLGARAPVVTRRPRRQVSAALAALGLNPQATLDEVEHAFREQAMRVHPDHGGSARAFKRLVKQYERAKKHAALGANSAAAEARPAPGSPAQGS